MNSKLLNVCARLLSITIITTSLLLSCASSEKRRSQLDDLPENYIVQELNFPKVSIDEYKNRPKPMRELENLVNRNMAVSEKWLIIDEEVIKKRWPHENNFSYYAEELMAGHLFSYKRDSIIALWKPLIVETALKTDNVAYRDKYFRLLDRLNYPRKIQFTNVRLKPGEFFRIEGRYRTRKSGIFPKLKIQYYKAVLDESQKVKEFISFESDEVVPTISEPEIIQATKIFNCEYDYKKKFTKPGLYRAVVSGKDYFRQVHFEVSPLDMYLKVDANRLYVWVTSYQNRISGPFDLTLINSRSHFVPKREYADFRLTKESGGEITTTTDSNGFAVFNLNDSMEYADIKVLAQKDDLFTYAKAVRVNHYKPSQDVKQVAHQWTNRSIYRPGQKVYIKGVVRSKDCNNTLSKAQFKEYTIKVINHQRETIYENIVTLNKWGHYNDSLALDSIAGQGTYRVILHLENKDPNLQVDKYDEIHTEFIVETFKKNFFDVTTTLSKNRIISGDSVDMSISAKYYAGGFLSGAKAKIFVYEDVLRDRFNYETYETALMPSGERNLLHTHDISLDAQGQFLFTIDDTKFNTETHLIVKAEIVDKKGDIVSSETKLKVFPRQIIAKIKNQGFRYNVNETYNIITKVNDVVNMGHGAVDSVKVSLHHQKIKDNNSYKPLLDTTISIDSLGICDYSYKFKKEGKYRCIVEPIAPGKEVLADTITALVGDKKETRYEHLLITTDKKVYNPGDWAEITMRSASSDVMMLLQVESKRVYHSQVVKLKGNQLVYRIPILKKYGSKILFSGIYLSEDAMVFTKQEIEIEDKESVITSKIELPKIVDPGETVSVKVSLKDFQNRAVAGSFSLSLIDEANRDAVEKSSYFINNDIDPLSINAPENGLNSDIHISNISYEYLALRNIHGTNEEEYDIYNRTHSNYHGNNGMRNILNFSNYRAVATPPRENGAYMCAPSAPKKESKRGRRSRSLGSTKEAPTGRGYFKELVYWNPSIETDENGVAEFEIKIPDQSSTWSLVIMGSDSLDKFIYGETTIESNNKISLTLDVPTFMVEGDSLNLSAMLYNPTKNRLLDSVIVDILNGESLVRLSQTKVVISAEPESNVVVKLPMKAMKAGKVLFQVRLKSLYGSQKTSVKSLEKGFYISAHNRVKKTHEHRVLHTSSTGKISTKIDLPISKDIIKDESSLRVVYTPWKTYSIFNALYKYVRVPTNAQFTFPQTLTNHFESNMQLVSVIQFLDIVDARAKGKIANSTVSHIHRLQKELSKERGYEGMWKLWGNYTSSINETCLMVSGIVALFNHDFSKNISDPILSKAEVMLKNSSGNLWRYIGERDSTTEHNEIASLYVLSKSVTIGDAPRQPLYKFIDSKNSIKRMKKVFNKHYKNRATLSVYNLCKMAETAANLGLHKQKNVLIKQLESMVITMKTARGEISFLKANKDYSYGTNDMSNTIDFLGVLVRTKPNHPLIPSLINELTTDLDELSRVFYPFLCKAIYYTALHVKHQNENVPDAKVTFTLDGKTINEIRINKTYVDSIVHRNNALIDTLVVPLHLLNYKSKLQVTLSGKGSLYLDVQRNYAKAEEPIAAYAKEISIERKYATVSITDSNDSNYTTFKNPVVDEVNVGDIIEVSLLIKCDTAYRNIEIEDFIPAGTEIVSEVPVQKHGFSDYLSIQTENREDRKKIHIDRIYDSKLKKLRYFLRAKNSGSFHVLPTTIRALKANPSGHDPDYEFNSRELRLKIR